MFGNRWGVSVVVVVGLLALAGCEEPLRSSTSQSGSGGSGSSSPPATSEESVDEDEDLAIGFGSVSECIVGDWEYDNQSFADMIATGTGYSPITVTGSVLVTFTATDYTATYQKWSTSFSAPEGVITQIIEGVEEGTWSMTESDQMTTQVASDNTVGVLNVESPQGSMSFPTNESDEMNASLSGPMTCDQDTITLSGENGYLTLNRR